MCIGQPRPIARQVGNPRPVLLPPPPQPKKPEAPVIADNRNAESTAAAKKRGVRDLTIPLGSGGAGLNVAH
jgi:hypothetical protein